MKKLESGYYKIKPKSAYTEKKEKHDDMYYTYTTRDYNSTGEEVFQIHIHEPESLPGKIKHKIFQLFRIE